MFLLDTNVISTLRRPKLAPPSLTAWAASTSSSEMHLSAVSLYELELGIRSIERRDQVQGEILRNWLTKMVLPQFRDRIIPFGEAIAVRAAALNVPDPRPERDSFIAATALTHRLTLVTRNVRDFAPMGVEIFNPWEGH
jgi:predicted nucleic acid-binding protein